MHWLLILLGYVIGATPFGFMAGKMKGIDIREHGSGNIGATNVLRTLGKPIGYVVFILDMLKGAAPVIIAKILAADVEPVNVIPVLTCLATILGHNFTFWLGFKGGKGIATSAGALFPLLPLTILAGVVAWIVVFALTRYVSLGSIAAAIALPTVQFVQAILNSDWGPRLPFLLLTLLMCVMAVYRHKSNIRKLMDGTESRFTRKKKEAEVMGDSGVASAGKPDNE